MTQLKTAERRAAFVEDWRAGVTLEALAERYGWKGRSGPAKAARRMGLPDRGRSKRNRVLRTDDQERAFARDWEIGMPLKELAALHGFQSTSGVSQAAARLGLAPRSTGGRVMEESPARLERGRWVPGPRGVMVWEEEAA